VTAPHRDEQEKVMADLLGRVLPVANDETTAIQATRMIHDNALHGIIVADRHGRPRFTVSSVDVLRLLVPEYIVEDPALARVLDADAAREVLARMAPRTIAALFDDGESVVREIAVVPEDASPLEIAAELIRSRTSVAWVGESAPPRFVTLTDLLGGVASTDVA
jgi:hypothetical protein